MCRGELELGRIETLHAHQKVGYYLVLIRV
jgi:hypothetical protein